MRDPYENIAPDLARRMRRTAVRRASGPSMLQSAMWLVVPVLLVLFGIVLGAGVLLGWWVR